MSRRVGRGAVMNTRSTIESCAKPAAGTLRPARGNENDPSEEIHAGLRRFQTALSVLLASSLLCSCLWERTHQARTDQEMRDELRLIAAVAAPPPPSPHWPKIKIRPRCVSRTIEALAEFNHYDTLDLDEIGEKQREEPDKAQGRDLSPRVLDAGYVEAVLGPKVEGSSCAESSTLRATRVQFHGRYAIAYIRWSSTCGMAGQLIKFQKRGSQWAAVAEKSLYERTFFECSHEKGPPRRDRFTVLPGQPGVRWAIPRT